MPRFILLLKNRFVYTILLSNLFSQLGIWIRNFAVLLYVMEKSNADAFAVSMISVAEYATIFVFSFIGGVFADRWRPKRTIVWCECLSTFSVFIVFLLLDTGSWTAVFFATLSSSIFSQFAQPSGMKLLKIHVSDEDAPVCILHQPVVVDTCSTYHCASSASHFYRKPCIGHKTYRTGICRPGYRDSHPGYDGSHALGDEFGRCVKKYSFSSRRVWIGRLLFPCRHLDHDSVLSKIKQKTQPSSGCVTLEI